MARRRLPGGPDLVVDRSAFDRIIQAGGYISVNTGAAPEANATPVPRDNAQRAFQAAECIGCGACVAACPNASACCSWRPRSPTSASCRRVSRSASPACVSMVNQHDHEGFGGCTNIGECSSACPKEIPLDVISTLNKDLRTALVHGS